MIDNRHRLQRRIQLYGSYKHKLIIFYQKAKLISSIIGLRNRVQTAIAIISATLESREIRGTHYLIEDIE